jgi:hypothetical protein
LMYKNATHLVSFDIFEPSLSTLWKVKMAQQQPQTAPPTTRTYIATLESSPQFEPQDF